MVMGSHPGPAPEGKGMPLYLLCHFCDNRIGVPDAVSGGFCRCPIDLCGHGFNVPLFPPGQKIQAAFCPYCEGIFFPAPTRDGQPCPLCNEPIYIRGDGVCMVKDEALARDAHQKQMREYNLASYRDMKESADTFPVFLFSTPCDGRDCSRCAGMNGTYRRVDETTEADIPPFPSCPVRDGCRGVPIAIDKWEAKERGLI